MALEVKNLPAMQDTSGMRVPSLAQEEPLEEGMAIHCSILAWRIPWTERPGRLQSTGSQRDITEQIILSVFQQLKMGEELASG